VIVLYWKVKIKENNNRTIIYKDYKRLNVEKFKRLVSSHLNMMEKGINMMANKTVNMIIRKR